MDYPAWQGGFPIQTSAFGGRFQTGPNHEDWEDWLRWDPAAEAASPEDDNMHSGSSKNDSPVQDVAIPAGSELFGKANDTLMPPLIMGEDSLDLGLSGIGEDEAFLFGGPDDTTANFDFQPLPGVEPSPQHSVVPKIDTNTAAWSLQFNADAADMDLSALTSDNFHSLPSAGTLSSNAPSLHYSPEATSQHDASVASNSPPAPKKRGGRKRKVDIEEEMLEREMNGDSNEEEGEPPFKKTSHNVIEKRYRNNLNDKIVELRNSVPALRAVGRAKNGKDTEELEGLTPAHKLNKATVMAKATEYIKHLEKRNQTMADEMAAMKARLAAVEKAIGNTRDRQVSINQSSTGNHARSRQTSSSSQTGVPAFLNVPQEQTRFNQQIVQQQYMQPQSHVPYARPPNAPVEALNQQQHKNGRGGRGVMNKVMMGAMAGVMVMEGVHNEQQASGDSSARGLLALPTHLLKRTLGSASPSNAASLSEHGALPLLKVFLVISVLAYLLVPLLTFPSRHKQPKRPVALRLPHLPSLASPIEVRRKAWLTAIQTVWVPKHFLLEVLAVTLKMISLSMRRLVGSEAFNTLTGANKEDEIARIKAWDIAIDAQLAGGDQQVSYYRLLLTLMESGTLPDSPTRLMQKAVHFRVFFWEVANAGYGNILGFKHFTEKVGKFYWESARRQHNELVYARDQSSPSSDEEGIECLPDHLARLVELDCDEVLSDEMIQRAWNLAWNEPSAYRTKVNVARDSVVEDHAIRSPMDAVAAWYANMTVDDTLAASLSPISSVLDIEYYIGLAVSIAPPASGTLARALAAKAVLSNSNRDANVIAALDSLPPAISALAHHSSPAEMNVVNHIPASPDVHNALTLAKLLALSSPAATLPSRSRSVDTIAALRLPPAGFTLLTAVAACRVLKSFTSDARRFRTLDFSAKLGLEDLAANLRIWVGTSSFATSGLSGEECALVVDLCLSVAKKVGGWEEERDSGYGSGGGSPVGVRAGLVM